MYLFTAMITSLRKTDHLTLKKKKKGNQEWHSTQQEDERTARGQDKIKGKNRCITVLFSK